MTAIWRPSVERVQGANLTRFVAFLRGRGEFVGGREDVPLEYGVLHEWSVTHPERFWRAVVDFCGAGIGGIDEASCVGLDRMAPPDDQLGPKWFVGARLNFAENLLRYRDEQHAIIAWNEEGRQQSLTFQELYQEVARIAAWLREAGVGVGDRVAGFMPNIPETVIAMLATTSLGAIWSSCSPDLGVQGVLDRFGQITPKVLVCADGYRYAGKVIDCVPRIREISMRISSIAHLLVVPSRDDTFAALSLPNAHNWRTVDSREGVAPLVDQMGLSPLSVEATASQDASINQSSIDIDFVQLPFDHPVYIMYSSGTTGLPKCMVHGAGGTLIQHLKELTLHTDLTRSDRICYFTTCGWMMWNWLVSSLAVGATVVLYDGAPLHPDHSILWDMIEQEQISVFGTSAKFLAHSEKVGLEPYRTHNLRSLRTILSTGSPLADNSYDYVYTHVKPDVHLASISGGTDIISCFALGNPTAPVYRGELQCRGLGMAVSVYHEHGADIVDAPGELVCTKPFPSMPVRFWDDPDGTKYQAAYFEIFPNVWRHGDWAELTKHDGVIIYGRSDATLNPSGVRIGTAEIYRQVEQLPEIIESVAVGQELGHGAHGDVRIVLFVRLRDGVIFDDALTKRIRQQIRDNTSPLHVPKIIIPVTDIPRTISGKITEIAVREVIHGRPVKNADALANPEALSLFRDLPALRV
jgi:acetoacetyl-CoA synthetase